MMDDVARELWFNGRIEVLIPIGKGTPLDIDPKELIKQCFGKEEVSNEKES
jgi:hypothetical protein